VFDFHFMIVYFVYLLFVASFFFPSAGALVIMNKQGSTAGAAKENSMCKPCL